MRSAEVSAGASGGVSLLIDPPLIYWLGLDGAAIGLVISRFVMLVVAFIGVLLPQLM